MNYLPPALTEVLFLSILTTRTLGENTKLPPSKSRAIRAD